MNNSPDFTALYNEFYPKILRYLNGLIGEHEAEELTQTVFEKINLHLDSFKGESKLSTWIYRIATNTALDKLKSASFKYSQAGPLAPQPIQENSSSKSNYLSASPDAHIVRTEMGDCIREFVDKLSPDYRTIIGLSDMEGFSNKEIADILQISLNTVKIRLHRARTALKNNMESGCDFYSNDVSELGCDRKQPKQK